MVTPPKKARSRKEQLQLDRARWLGALGAAVADDQSPVTSATFFVVWTLVTRYLNEANEAYPAAETLGLDVGLNERAVREHLDRAVASGLLLKRRIGRMQPNVYSLNLAILGPSSDRAIHAGHSGDVTGSADPVTSPPTGPAVGVLDGHPVQVEGVDDSHSVHVTGRFAQSDRAIDDKVTGAKHPANHVVDNHEEEPRRATRDARPGARTRPSSSDSNPDSDPTSDAGDVSDDEDPPFT